MSVNETSASQGAAPPPGVTPNYVDPVNAAWGVIPAGWVLISISIVLVTVRIVAKFRYKQAPPLVVDDYLCLAAVLFGLVRVVMVTVLVAHYGIGRHQWDVPPQNFKEMWYLFNIEDIIYCLGILCAKLSILSFYLTLFKVNRLFRIAAWITIGITTAYLLGAFFTYVFHCGVHTWEGSEQCMNGIKQEVAIGAFNIVTDFIILVLPLTMVWTLHLKIGKKLALSFVFGLGIVALAASITREVYAVTTLGFADQTWVTSSVVVWKTVEMLVGIICANLLTGTFVFQYILETKAAQSLVRLLSSRGGQRTREAFSLKTSDWNHGSKTDVKPTSSVSSGKQHIAPDESIELGHVEARVIV